MKHISQKAFFKRKYVHPRMRHDGIDWYLTVGIA